MKCDLLAKEGCGGGNKLSTSSSSTQAHKEDIFMGGENIWLAKVNNLLVPWLDLCWDYIFSLLSLWSYPPEEGDS